MKIIPYINNHQMKKLITGELIFSIIERQINKKGKLIPSMRMGNEKLYKMSSKQTLELILGKLYLKKEPMIETNLVVFLLEQLTWGTTIGFFRQILL